MTNVVARRIGDGLRWRVVQAGDPELGPGRNDGCQAKTKPVDRPDGLCGQQHAVGLRHSGSAEVRGGRSGHGTERVQEDGEDIRHTVHAAVRAVR